MANKRWKNRPACSTWGDWGEDDQRGRMNMLTPEKRKLGFAEVREGIAFPLSLPLDLPGGTGVNPRRLPPKLGVAEPRSGHVNFNVPMRLIHDGATDIVCDDTVLLTLQYSTQWDSFAHVGQYFDADGDGKDEMVFYNGYRAGEDIIGPVDYSSGSAKPAGEHVGALKLGVENLFEACPQGRAVMIDIFEHFGLGKRYVGYDDLMRIMKKDNVVVEPGDMVCLRTGFDRWIYSKNGKIRDRTEVDEVMFGLDGRDEKLLNWVTDSGVLALISDNVAVELTPGRPIKGPGPALPLHAHCLFKLGVHLGEMWLLSDLAEWLRAHGRSRFLLTAPPLRLPRAVGSPANAIATV